MRIRWLKGTGYPRRKGYIEDCTRSGATPDLVEIWVKRGLCEILPEPKPEPPVIQEKPVKDRPKVRTRAIEKAPETKDE